MIVLNQRRNLLRLLADLRPHWRRDRDLPARIRELFSKHRGWGSRDRRLYRELLFTTLRYLDWIEPQLDFDEDRAVAAIAWLAADTPATCDFRRTLLVGWPACPDRTSARAAVLQEHLAIPGPLPTPMPEWFRGHCPEAFEPEQVDAMLSRAAIWLRLQTTDPGTVLEEFAGLGWEAQVSRVLPDAVRLPPDSPVQSTRAYQDGQVEIQDLGSQLVLEAVGIEPGSRCLDACAGAGGKTLQLARLAGRTGQLEAHDVRSRALAELRDRARRAGLSIGKDGESASSGTTDAAPVTIVDAPNGGYDLVLVDAPCSGSGTWRRAPHLKCSTTPASIEAASLEQAGLLSRFAEFVRPGGRLVYATCSLSRFENSEVVLKFLEEHPEFVPVPPARDFGFLSGPAKGLTILPAAHDTDGFYVNVLSRAS
jgi:16S rRNA (cytosine967-C5)-methyltransferase